MAQTIATSLEKLNTALEGDKSALKTKSVTVSNSAKHSDIPKLIAQITNGSNAKITVNCSEEYNGTTLTFKNGTNVITEKVSNGICEVYPDKEGTWTVTNTVDSQQLTCYVVFNYYALNLYAKPILVELCSADALNDYFVKYQGKNYSLKICHETPPYSGTTDISLNKDKSILMWVDGSTVKISTQEFQKKVHFTKTWVNYDEPDAGNFDHSLFVHGYYESDSDGYSDPTYYQTTKNIFTDIDLGDADFSGIKNLAYLFDECTSLKTIDMSKVTGLTSGSLTNINYMFYNNSNLTSLKLPTIDTSNVTDMSGVFYRLAYNSSTALNTLDLSSWKTDKVKNFMNMFSSCNVKTLDITNFTAKAATKVNTMFSGCKATTIYCKNDWTSNSTVTDCTNMFSNANNLSGKKGDGGAYAKPKSLGGNFTVK